MGGVAKTIKKAASNPVRSLANAGTFGTYELGRKMLPGITRPLEGFGKSLTGQGQSDGPDANSYPFMLDPAMVAQNKADILGEGNRQYGDTLKGISELSLANTKRAKDLFAETLPDIAENAQAAHLYDSTGYGQEVARQQSSLASQVANDEAQRKFDALAGRQGFETSALQRGMSLEDFIAQANVAKSIGAQMAPQVPSGKATGLSGGVAGAGAGAKIGGPWGAGIGGLAGLIMGSNANKRGK